MLLVANGYEEMAVESDHALAVEHKDPFDRILLAQARVERVLLMTGDTQILTCGGGVVAV